MCLFISASNYLFLPISTGICNISLICDFLFSMKFGGRDHPFKSKLSIEKLCKNKTPKCP
jgi:hypothetical protein